MKKITAILLALALLVLSPLAVFAAGGSASASASGSSTVDVNGEFVSAADPATVVSVDIAWEALQFTYTAASAGTWNPQTHQYDGKHDAYWSDNKAAITVTNHSNSEIKANFNFHTIKDNLKGVFYTQNADNTYTPMAGGYIALPTAVGTEKTAAPTGKLFFGIDPTSVAITEQGAQGSIGTIFISIVQQPLTVATEAELRAAVTNLKNSGGTIRVTSDITLTQRLEITAGTGTSASPLVIDLGSKTISGKGITINGTATSRSYVTIMNGDINAMVDSTEQVQYLTGEPNQSVVYIKYATVILQMVSVSGRNLLAVENSTGGRTTICGGTMAGEISFQDQYNSGMVSDDVAIYNSSSFSEDDGLLTLSHGPSVTDDVWIINVIVSNDAIQLLKGTRCQFPNFGSQNITAGSEDAWLTSGTKVNSHYVIISPDNFNQPYQGGN